MRMGSKYFMVNNDNRVVPDALSYPQVEFLKLPTLEAVN